MGSTIKRQFLTTAVISLFVWGSVGVATAGVMTTLDGTLKGKLWCGTDVAGQAAQTDDATKTKIKDDVTIVWDFSLFPEISAILTNPTTLLEWDLAGTAVRKNDKKGFFILNGVETTTPGDFAELNLQGEYKNDKDAMNAVPPENVPTKIRGKFTLTTLAPANFGDPNAVPCVSETGNFKAKGDGTQF